MSQSPIAESLAQLTAGWTASPTGKAESLSSARKALAASLLLGMESSNIHPGLESLPQSPPQPDLTAELHSLITSAPELTTLEYFGVVRSSVSLDPNNPSGLPAAVRGMRIQQTLVPFIDVSGASHFVDLFAITRQASIAFGSATGIFGIFPVTTGILGPKDALALGAGSVWFTSNLLVSTLPAGSFSGFRISKGHLKASAPFQLQGNVYVLPATATVILTATLDPPAAPLGGSSIGKDAESDTVQLPKTVSIVFSQSSAAVEALDPSSATVYGTSVALTRNANPPIAFNNNTAILVPCSTSITGFAFASVASTEFVPSGTATIVGTGWVLPIAQTILAALGQAAGAGSLLIRMGAGASAQWKIHPAVVPLSGVQLLLKPSRLGPRNSVAEPAQLCGCRLVAQRHRPLPRHQ